MRMRVANGIVGVAVGLALVAASVASGASGPISGKLSADEKSDLSEHAQRLYGQAMAQADRVLYDSALESLDRAAIADKSHVALQLLNAGSQRSRAEGKMGAESRELFARALASLDRVTSNPLALRIDRERAWAQRRAITERLSGVSERDDRRRAFGRSVQQAYGRQQAKAPLRGGSSGGLILVGGSSGGGGRSAVRADVSFSSGRSRSSGTQFSTGNSTTFDVSVR
jgi:hypothetical protein